MRWLLLALLLLLPRLLLLVLFLMVRLLLALLLLLLLLPVVLCRFFYPTTGVVSSEATRTYSPKLAYCVLKSGKRLQSPQVWESLTIKSTSLAGCLFGQAEDMIENGDMEGDDGKEFVEDLQASCLAVSHSPVPCFFSAVSSTTEPVTLFDLDYI